jgi:predicted SAM-dependent methyltransferase
MRFRLIAGTINRYQPEAGWINVHMDVSSRPIWITELSFAGLPDVVGDVANMVDFRDEMFDEVRMHHVIEHLPLERARSAFHETWRVLKPHGTFDIEVPDLDRVVRAWLADELDDGGVQQWLYGEQLANHEPGDSHRYGWTERNLIRELSDANFMLNPREETGLALRFIAQKPEMPAA